MDSIPIVDDINFHLYKCLLPMAEACMESEKKIQLLEELIAKLQFDCSPGIVSVIWSDRILVEAPHRVFVTTVWWAILMGKNVLLYVCVLSVIGKMTNAYVRCIYFAYLLIFYALPSYRRPQVLRVFFLSREISKIRQKKIRRKLYPRKFLLLWNL